MGITIRDGPLPRFRDVFTVFLSQSDILLRAVSIDLRVFASPMASWYLSSVPSYSSVTTPNTTVTTTRNAAEWEDGL